jgi:TonB-dependent starch-binding outer membrane protein SusC
MRLALALALAAMALATATLSDPLLAQGTGRVTGLVTGDNGQPIEGVQLTLANTRYGALSNASGRYTISGVPAGEYQLRAQRIGWRPVTQAVSVRDGAATTADVRMEAQATSLTATVVVGYTTQLRRDISDATAGVDAAVIQNQQVATVEEALRGRLAGVQINASGEPGRPAQVVIRGQNFLGNPTPLYVVDGMYLRQNPNLNPDDIESMEVLKDASAAAQYGAQAANGVIVIRTRRGRSGDENRVELRSYYGRQDIPNRIEMMDSQQWAAIQQQAYQNSALPVPSGVTAALAGNATSTDWQDAVFRSGAIQDHNLSVSGGTPTAAYLLSGGVLDQQGSVIETNFRRYSLRVNSDARRGRFQVGENIAISRGLRKGLVADPLTGFPLTNMVRMLPTIPVRDPANPSGYGYGSGATPTFGTSPVGLLEQRPQTERSNQIIGSAFGEFQILPSLKYRLNLGLNYENYGRSEFRSIAQIRMGSPNQFADLTEIRNDFTSLLAENLLNYDQQFGGNTHRVSAVAGYTEQQQNADDVTAFRRGFSDEALRTINAGGEANSSNSGTRTNSALHAFLLRGNYTLLDRYILTASVRRDGSSRFGASHRWGTFSAASVGWIVSDEAFFRSIPVVGSASFLKLRASTGTLGNQDIGDYRYSVPLEQNRLGYTFGGVVAPGATQTSLANPDIRWQSNRQSNVGLDISAFNEALSFTLDAYGSTSTGLLVSAPLPWSLGVPDPNLAPVVNAGSMKNSGLEFSLTHRYGADAGGARARSSGFHLNTTATLTTTKNQVLSLGNGGQPIFDQTGAARTAVGSPVGTFYLVRTGGIFQSAAEVAAHTTTLANGQVRVIQPKAQPGDVRYLDSNGDGQINDDDRVEIGNGTPKYSGGLFFDAGWRAVDLGVNLRGARGFKIFNAVRYWTDRMDDPSNYRAGFAPWSPTNPSTTTPRALAAGNDNTRFLSDRWVEDGDFLRVQNVTVGYRLPESVTRLVGGGQTNDSRIYLSMQNLHTFTSYSNWDPETLGFGNPLGRGIDDGRIYPNVRTITVGLDLRL